MNRQVWSVSEDGMNLMSGPGLLRRFSDEDNVGVVWPRVYRGFCRPVTNEVENLLESKLVICRPREPSSGCTQRLSTPFSRIG